MVATEPVSYHTSKLVRAISVPFVPRAWMRIRLMPGRRATLLLVHVACQAVQAEVTPATTMVRVSMALAVPRKATVGLVVRGKPFETVRPLETVSTRGICERTQLTCAPL